MLETLLTDWNVLFYETDKGHGPFAGTSDQYISDTLLHLNDKNIFCHLLPAEAHAVTELTLELITE